MTFTYCNKVASILSISNQLRFSTYQNVLSCPLPWVSLATSHLPDPRTANTPATTAAADDAPQVLSSPASSMPRLAAPLGKQQCVLWVAAAVTVSVELERSQYFRFSKRLTKVYCRCPYLAKLPWPLSKQPRTDPYSSSAGGIGPVIRVHCVRC